MASLGAAHQRAQARAGREQAGGLAVHQFHAVGFGDVDAADALQLQQLAFHHHLGEADQQVEDVEIALAQGDLKGLHVQPVAGQHAGVIAPVGVGGRAAAARLGDIDHVVVHQRGGVDHFDHGGHADGAVGDRCRPVCEASSTQDGPQALAAAVLQILADGGDGIDGGHRFQADLVLHLFQIAS